LAAKEIPQRLVDRLRHNVIKDTTEWQFRFRQAGYRVLLSLLFYSSSKECFKNRETVLPAIGLYYSFFHLNLGLMAVYPYRKLEETSHFPLDKFRQKAYGFDRIMNIPQREMRHRQVDAFVKDLSRKCVLTNEYSTHFDFVKGLRLEVNYRPHYFGDCGIRQNIQAALDDSEQFIEEGCSIIKRLSDCFYETLEKHGKVRHVHDYLPSFIGDGIMDDFLQNYATEKEEKTVISLLDRFDLTT